MPTDLPPRRPKEEPWWLWGLELLGICIITPLLGAYHFYMAHRAVELFFRHLTQ